jgi:hypothetical protein
MPDIDIVSMLIFFLLLSLVYTLLMPQMLWLQARVGIRQLQKSVRLLERWSKESRTVALRAFTKHGRTKRDIREEFDNLLEFFAIEPVSEDPVGVLRRLEHILDVRKRRFEHAVARLAPKAEPEGAANLEMVMEGAIASYVLYRIVRHFMLLAEKTKNVQLTMLIQMNIPFLKEYAKGFLDATKAFAEGKPIGDGVGPLAVALAAGNAEWREGVENTVYAQTKFDGRKVLVVKAKGPGGRVGKPGELIKQLAKRRKISRIIMIDAAGKLEGERSGEVIEGVGAAIGGPPVEKYKIEEIATKLKIPVDAIVIKESFTEAIRPMHRKLAQGSKVAAERAKQAILERTRRGETAILAGIGNTIGIGQRPEEIPREFPPPPEKKPDAIESAQLLVR